jgi:two-component sensor histidine kinase
MQLVNHQIEPFRPGDGDRVKVAGPAIRLNAQAAQTLGMAMHELATNAAKYGAFRGDGGKLVVAWTRNGIRLELSWRERVKSLPPVNDRKGFGTSVLESMVTAALGAKVTRTLHADGIEWRFDIPLARIEPGSETAEAVENDGLSPA